MGDVTVTVTVTVTAAATATAEQLHLAGSADRRATELGEGQLRPRRLLLTRSIRPLRCTL